jgi:phage gp16-like protein
MSNIQRGWEWMDKQGFHSRKQDREFASASEKVILEQTLTRVDIGH